MWSRLLEDCAAHGGITSDGLRSGVAVGDVPLGWALELGLGCGVGGLSAGMGIEDSGAGVGDLDVRVGGAEVVHASTPPCRPPFVSPRRRDAIPL